MSDSFAGARDRIAAGDVAGLRRLLEADPGLVTARWPGAETPYEGYFHRPTLLHHLSGNPLVQPVPPNAVELATLLLDGGAEVDAVTAAGPAQPTDIGWTPLGLVATSLAAREAGVQLELMDLLLARGADPDALRGGGLMGALYYGEPAAAERLAAAGAALDLVAAAGLGRLDVVERFLLPEGGLAAGAHALVHYSQGEDPAGPEDVLTLALLYAAWCGHLPVVERLVEAGADVNRPPCFDHRASVLHWAAQRGRRDVARQLVERGAELGARDDRWRETPASWARSMGFDELADELANS